MRLLIIIFFCLGFGNVFSQQAGESKVRIEQIEMIKASDVQVTSGEYLGQTVLGAITASDAADGDKSDMNEIQTLSFSSGFIGLTGQAVSISQVQLNYWTKLAGSNLKYTGNVGINVDPTYPLHVEDSTSARLVYIKNNNASLTSGEFVLMINNAAHVSNVSSAGAFKVLSKDGRFFEINGFGKIGMNTTASYTFDIEDDNTLGLFRVKATNTSTATGRGVFEVDNSGAGSNLINGSSFLVKGAGASETKINAQGQVSMIPRNTSLDPLFVEGFKIDNTPDYFLSWNNSDKSVKITELDSYTSLWTYNSTWNSLYNNTGTSVGVNTINPIFAFEVTAKPSQTYTGVFRGDTAGDVPFFFANYADYSEISNGGTGISEEKILLHESGFVGFQSEASIMKWHKEKYLSLDLTGTGPTTNQAGALFGELNSDGDFDLVWNGASSEKIVAFEINHVSNNEIKISERQAGEQVYKNKLVISSVPSGSTSTFTAVANMQRPFVLDFVATLANGEGATGNGSSTISTGVSGNYIRVYWDETTDTIKINNQSGGAISNVEVYPKYTKS